MNITQPQPNEIVLPDYVSHEPGQTYFYAVRCANVCGQIERTLTSVVKVSIGNEGELRIGGPNSVFGLAAAMQRNGRVEIVWTYSPIEQESQPTEMRIYGDEGTGEINYQQAITIVPYKKRKFYRYESEQIENGRYRFAVRTADTKGNERESMREAAVEVRAVNPEAIEIIGIEAI